MTNSKSTLEEPLLSAQIYEVVSGDEGAYVCVPIEEKPKGRNQDVVHEENRSACRLKKILAFWCMAYLFLRLIHHGGCSMMRHHTIFFREEDDFRSSSVMNDAEYPQGLAVLRGSAPAVTQGAEEPLFYLFRFYDLPVFDISYIYELPTSVMNYYQSEPEGKKPENVSAPGFVYVRMRVFLAEDLNF